MAKNELVLMAEPREIHGKKVKRLRREGLVPGVVYGPVIDETVSVSVNGREFYKFYMAHGHSTIFTLKWDGGSQPVLIREVQVDPVRRDMLHIDFFAPDMNVTLRQAIPVTLHGAAELTEEGAVLQHVLNEIEIEALPADLPSDIQVDISGLTSIGDSIKVGDLEAPEKTTIVSDPEMTIASIILQAEEPEEEPEVEEGEEGEEAEEGAETEGEESEDEGGDEESSEEE